MKSSTKPCLVSIIIPNWNGAKYLEKCLLSLKEQTQKDFELIVVDNGSSDNSVSLLKKIYPQAKLIKNKKNLGFARALNQGIKKAKGEFIISLNNDVMVVKDWLENLLVGINKSKENKKVGMWGCKILSSHQPKKIYSTGILVERDFTTTNRGIDEVDRGQYDQEIEIFGPSAACGVYRKRMLEEIGLFDEDYFCYREDDELATRAQLLGWRAQFVPEAVCYHHRSATVGVQSLFKLYYTERNRIFSMIKFFSFREILSSVFYTAERYGKFVKQRRKSPKESTRKPSLFQLVLVLIKAYLAAFGQIPRMWKKRQALMMKVKFPLRLILK
jgi:hypothetical protein